MRLSNLPGRSRAGSSTSGRFVAASMITPFDPSKPSISVRSWLRVCSLSSFVESMPLSRFFPIVSISSIKTMQGACFSAWANKSLTFDAPMPTNISTNSEPAMEKNGTSASPATAFASSVFPVPGGPTSRAPFGQEAPISAYFFGSCRYRTSSCRSCFASSSPATSLKVMLVVEGTYFLAPLFPNDIIGFPPKRPPPESPPPVIFFISMRDRSSPTP